MSNDWKGQIFIQNIPYEVSEDELAAWCETFGPVAQCRLKYDRHGYSRGFAFVTFSTSEGHYRMLSEGPHFCRNRRLTVRESKHAVEETSVVPIEPSIDEENFYTEPDNPAMNDDRYDNELIQLRDDFEANIEMLKIQHEHEIKLLNEQIRKETERRDEAKKLYSQAEEDFQEAEKQNAQLRENLIKNTMQTFNLRRDFARQIKEANLMLIDHQSNRK